MTETSLDRRILHCDMDCFYAAVHVRDDPSLRNQPVVIGGRPEGRGVIAAASYEARRFGVHSAMPSSRAIRLCSDLVFIRPDFPRYRRESDKIFAIYRDFTNQIQPVSIDEAFLDVTADLDPLGSATAVARAIRQRVREDRGLTVSVGVGPNKLIAKIASDFDKPDGLTIVRPSQVDTFLAPLPVRRLHGVGPATEKALQELGVETVEDLRGISQAVLEERFGSHGRGLWAYCRGLDNRPVETSQIRKSLGKETTFERDLVDLEVMDEVLVDLSTGVALALQKREMAAFSVTVKVRFDDFVTVTRSKTCPVPFDDVETLGRIAKDLLRDTEAPKRRVRLLGVTVSRLLTGGPVQLWLF